MQKQDYKQAIHFFEFALKHSAKAVKNYQYIAQAFVQEKNDAKAMEYYLKAVEYNPEDCLLYLEFTKFLVKQNDLKKAQRMVKKAYKLEEGNIEGMNLLFYVNYLLAKENLYDYNIKEAIEIARKIEETYPGMFAHAKEKAELESKQEK